MSDARVEIEHHKIGAVKDLIPLVEPRQHETVSQMFRGHRDRRWELMPSLFRRDKLPVLSSLPVPSEWAAFENELLQNFWRRAVAITSKPSTKIERLAVAQHHGLCTRLLDWSRSPLVALSFAVEEAKCACCDVEPDGTLWEVSTSVTADPGDRLDRVAEWEAKGAPREVLSASHHASNHSTARMLYRSLSSRENDGLRAA